MSFSKLHERALAVAGGIRKLEHELIDLLQAIDACRGFTELGYASLFVYVTEELRLSEACAYQFITVSRKCVEVPQMNMAIQKEELTVSVAKIIVPVINPENCMAWLEKAKFLSKRNLEKEVANANPEKPKGEKTRPLGNGIVRLEISITEDTHALLLRAQELLSQKKSCAVNLADALHALAEVFVKREDPVEKADRNTRNTRPGTSSEKIHKVHRRDRGRCQFVHANGKPCQQRKWLHVHHIKPKEEGGGDEPENLITLCSAHHKIVHTYGMPLH